MTLVAESGAVISFPNALTFASIITYNKIE